MPSHWRTDPQIKRCEAIKRHSVLSSSRRCELDAGHDGPHMAGLSSGDNLMSAWGEIVTADELRKFRREHKISQVALARRAGVAEITIRRFETGKRTPNRSTLQRIADAIDEIINDALVQWAKSQRCGCGHVGLRIHYRISVKPVGTFSLAGQGMKFSATELPWLVCPSCNAEAQGRFE